MYLHVSSLPIFTQVVRNMRIIMFTWIWSNPPNFEILPLRVAGYSLQPQTAKFCIFRVPLCTDARQQVCHRVPFLSDYFSGSYHLYWHQKLIDLLKFAIYNACVSGFWGLITQFACIATANMAFASYVSTSWRHTRISKIITTLFRMKWQQNNKS